MATPLRRREQIMLSFDPRGKEPYMIDLVRFLEGVLQRMEERIEELQDQVAALQQYNADNP